mmetsp:Transcript_45627/g.74386  ORF Transcript_45627/g.74386 Transcript_45627/m.74386 type:complete len:302 (+) Transcript_45627:99-1004(+)
MPIAFPSIDLQARNYWENLHETLRRIRLAKEEIRTQYGVPVLFENCKLRLVSRRIGLESLGTICSHVLLAHLSTAVSMSEPRTVLGIHLYTIELFDIGTVFQSVVWHEGDVDINVQVKALEMIDLSRGRQFLWALPTAFNSALQALANVPHPMHFLSRAEKYLADIVTQQRVYNFPQFTCHVMVRELLEKLVGKVALPSLFRDGGLQLLGSWATLDSLQTSKFLVPVSCIYNSRNDRWTDPMICAVLKGEGSRELKLTLIRDIINTCPSATTAQWNTDWFRTAMYFTNVWTVPIVSRALGL